MNLGNKFHEMTDKMAMPKLSMLALRVGLGVLYLWAGLSKLVAEYAGEGWSATGYLLNASYGPLAGFMANFADNMAVDLLEMWGLTFIGVALILGAATRWAAMAGIAIMTLFFLTELPPAHGWVSDRVIYILALNLIAVARAGTFFGVDGWLDWIEEKYPPLRFVLG